MTKVNGPIMKIHYVTGSRADFGLMKKVLQCLDAQYNFDIGCVVTGQHLLEHYGKTVSDIIESASFGQACINIGVRQKGRLRNENVVDCVHISSESLNVAFEQACRLRPPFINRYGDGRTAERLVDLLSTLELSQAALTKVNAY